jgi:hypothetical protein
MSSLGPSAGRPDHEEPHYPHGSILQQATGLAVLAAGQELLTVAFQEVGAYRSLVLSIKNEGASDIEVTPKWDFIAGNTSIQPSETQRVLAGTSKRMLFQNQGDILSSVHVQGVGGNSQMSYQMLPSNLDPLPRSAPDYLILYGGNHGVTNPPIGDNDHAKFDPSLAVSNDLSLWSFVLDAGGLVKEVDTSAAGRYESFVQGSFAAAGGVFQKTMVLNVFGAGPIPMSADVSDNGAFKADMFVGAFTELVNGTAQWTVQPSISAAGPVNFAAVYWWIKRWAI